jgi:hypothetical protein
MKGSIGGRDGKYLATFCSFSYLRREPRNGYKIAIGDIRDRGCHGFTLKYGAKAIHLVQVVDAQLGNEVSSVTVVGNLPFTL